jgi:hypothetical protein
LADNKYKFTEIDGFIVVDENIKAAMAEANYDYVELFNEINDLWISSREDEGETVQQ